MGASQVPAVDPAVVARVIDFAPRPDERPYVKIANHYEDSIVVIVEPWAGEHTLLRDDFIKLHSDTVVDGEIEVCSVPEGIVVWVNRGSEPRIFNKAGHELSLW